MAALPASARRLAATARRHPFAGAFVAATAVAVVAFEAAEGDPALPALAYLGACLAAVLVTEAVVGSDTSAAAPVRRPALEALLLGACQAVGLAFLWARLVAGVTPASFESIPARLAFVAGILFVFPVVPVLALLAWRYRPAELGLGLGRRALAAALACVAVLALASLTLAPGQVLWGAALREWGLGRLLLTCAVSAALPEELMRFLFQTRVGALLRSPAAGWIVASCLWALLHAPSWLRESPGMAMPGIAESATRILPLGLMLGYLTHRTRSIWPAHVVHATNLWGLQNVGHPAPLA